MARNLLISIVVLLLAMFAAGFGLRLFMDRAAEDRLRAGEDAAIQALREPLRANAFLACPPGYCALAEAVPSPVFPVDADRLYRLFARLIAAEPRIVTLLAEPQARRIVVIQRSAVFRFPDVVTAEFVALGPGRSGIALYSRARYGRADFGVNRRRVTAWLARLQRLVGGEVQ
ncbi:MAG TPA: DUF1499 domain-containing protein [Stellaceae bacterium]|nr:DUF1499 domain-containing protein [Stellaceae bacterium]